MDTVLLTIFAVIGYMFIGSFFAALTYYFADEDFDDGTFVISLFWPALLVWALTASPIILVIYLRSKGKK